MGERRIDRDGLIDEIGPVRSGRSPAAILLRIDQRRALDAGLAVCSYCRVRSECLTYAFETGSVGIWGNDYLPNERATRRANSAYGH